MIFVSLYNFDNVELIPGKDTITGMHCFPTVVIGATDEAQAFNKWLDYSPKKEVYNRYVTTPFEITTLPDGEHTSIVLDLVLPTPEVTNACIKALNLWGDSREHTIQVLGGWDSHRLTLGVVVKEETTHDTLVSLHTTLTECLDKFMK